MRKLFTILLALSLAQVGVGYAADTGTATLTNRDYIFGISKASQVNLNQVLFLLAGKDGTPGAPGKDGINGLDGLNGKDGLNGINGIDGVNGTNGINGNNGKDGINGINGTNGTNGKDGKDGKDALSTLDSTLAAPVLGSITTVSCTKDAKIQLKALFTSADFVMNEILFSTLANECGSGNGKISIYFRTMDAPFTLHYQATAPAVANYLNGETLKCTLIGNIPLSATWGVVPNPQFTIISSQLTCSNVTRPLVTPFTLNDIYTSDFTYRIGFEIYNGS